LLSIKKLNLRTRGVSRALKRAESVFRKSSGDQTATFLWMTSVHLINVGSRNGELP